MYDTILVATDGSDPARGALAYALAVADRVDADVNLVHVVELGDEMDRRLDRGRALLSTASSIAADRAVDATTDLVEGPPEDGIVRAVADRDADLVAMGTHGHSDLGERLLGSVTDRVLRAAPAPVLAVPPGVGPPAVDRICWPTDGSDHAAAVVPHAASLASVFDAPVTVFNAVDVTAEMGPFDAGGVDQEYVDRLLSAGESTAEEAAAPLTEAGPSVAVETAVGRGRPDEAILDHVRDAGVDLVAVGTGDRSQLGRAVLGSVTDRLLRTSPVPVLVAIEAD